MNILAELITSIGLGVGAGVNAYATFLVYGILARFYPSLIEGELATFFSSTPMLIAMGVMYTIEFFADKIPAIDHVWDAIHTFVRPLAGAALAFASASPDVPQGMVIVASILGGGAALGSHTLKASVRAGSTATTGGAANPVLSIIEDIYAVLQSVLAIFAPFVFAAVLLVIIVPSVCLLIWYLSRRSAARPLS